MNVISIGEVLFDLVGQQEFLGGAPFNFATHLCNLGHPVLFVSAVGDDPRGAEVLRQMSARGMSTEFVLRIPGQPTGTVGVILDEQAQPTFVIHRPAAYDFPRLSGTQFHKLVAWSPGWIYFGTLVQTSEPARRLTLKLLDSVPRLRRFYDVNLRPNCYNAGLVRDLLELASVVKLNDQEVPEITRMVGQIAGSVEEFCRSYARRFGWEAVCVTRGPDGCGLLIGDEYVRAKGYAIRVHDTVGAGDAFAAAFLHGFSSGWPAARIADFANRVGALVASRAGAVPTWTLEEALAL